MTLKNLAISSLVLGFIILIFYLFELWIEGYINPTSSFSVDRAKDISPFVGSFIAVFFSLGSTLLVLENLRLQSAINNKNQLLTQKNQFESIFFNLISLQNQIAKEINTDIYVSYKNGEIEKDVKGKAFFDCLAPSISKDFRDSKKKDTEMLLKIFDKYYDIHASDMGHYFRNMYHIVNYIDSSPYFLQIIGNTDYFQKKDYVKILRAQLTNNEIAILAINGLSIRGEAFKPLIEKYELLKNIHFDFGLVNHGFYPCIPAPELLVENYPHLMNIYEKQKNIK
jgi:hypothetical protein